MNPNTNDLVPESALTCPHRPPCPGCPRLGERDLAPDVQRGLDELAAAHGLPPVPVLRGEATGFRHRARLAVRGRGASPKIGIFAEGSHRIVDIPRCVIHHPLVNRVAGEVRRAMIATRVPPYSDDAHLGVVRYVQVVVERPTQTAQVVLVTNDDAPDRARPLLDALAERLGKELHSLHWNGNPARTNTILGPYWDQVSGANAVEERIGGARVFYPPGAFGQSHLDLADRIVERVHGWVPAGTKVAEYYAGTGPIGLGLALGGHEVAFNEVSPESLQGLSLGIAALGDGGEARTRVVPGTAGAAVSSMPPADVVIVDPPRKGLDAPLLAALTATPPSRLIYVACGFAAFQKDTAALTENGVFRLAELAAGDLFPYTDHVEVIARFERA